MLKNEDMGKFINKETLVIMNMDLKRRSHAENRRKKLGDFGLIFSIQSLSMIHMKQFKENITTQPTFLISQLVPKEKSR